MSPITRRCFRLVGPLEGQTVSFPGDINFIKGLMFFEGPEDNFETVAHLLANFYSAVPVPENEEGFYETSSPEPMDSVASVDVHPDLFSAIDARVPGSEGCPTDRPKQREEGSAGNVKGSIRDNDLFQAVMSLSPDDAKSWTVDGLPSINKLGKLLSRSVTRSEVNEVAPGFTKSKARSL